MKSFQIFGAVLLGFASFVTAQTPPSPTTPAIKLVVPESPVSYGDMIVVQAVVDKAGMPADLAEYKHQWIILDNSTGKKKSVMVWPDGTQAFFAAGMQAKQFTVILDTDLVFVHKEGEVIQKVWMEQPDILISTISVGESPPSPTPGPGPDPKPPSPPSPPVLPDGKFGLSKFSYDALSEDKNMTRDEKMKVASALESSFGEVAARIAALPTMKDVENGILPAIKQRNNEALLNSGVSVSSTQEFKKKLGDQIYSLYTTRKLGTADDFAVAFREIAQGLGAFR